jgi:6-pyruvoyltetrahydropterin/6-carboxytetrahydropterin synthase
MRNKLLTLHTEVVLDSSHQLRGYDGNCSRLHGHTWLIEIWIKGEEQNKDEVGILFDFGNVKKIKEEFDHRFLNDIEPFNVINSTAENLTVHFYNKLKTERPELMFKVRVYETYVGKKTWCEYGDWE